MNTLALDIAGVRLRAGQVGDVGFALDVPILRLRAGERVAITGPSGCGKSMLLEVLALLVRPAQIDRFVLGLPSGRGRDLAAEIASGRLDALSRLRAGPLAYVPQSGGVLPFLTARAHASAGLRLAGLAGDKAALARFVRLAQGLGLGPHLKKTREQLSGGQRKRVALLAGMCVPRRVLLADEPTTGLDAAASAAAMQTLADLSQTEGTAVLIATHDAAAAERAGFTVRPLDSGQFVHNLPEVAA